MARCPHRIEKAKYISANPFFFPSSSMIIETAFFSSEQEAFFSV
jgi:hypothetical protein